MPVFVPNQPIETIEPFVKVENQLTPGIYHFSLVVEDEHGRRSVPDVKVVTVTGPPPPPHPVHH
jgi:hypothetical protein